MPLRRRGSVTADLLTRLPTAVRGSLCQSPGVIVVSILSVLFTRPPGSSGLPDPEPPQQVGFQRCPRRRHPLPDRLPTPDRLLIDDVLGSRFDLEQNPLQDLLNDRPQPTGSRATLQGDPGDLPNCRIREQQVRTVEPHEFPKLLDQRPFRRMKNPGKVIDSQSIQRGDHRQPTDDLGDQPEGFEVFWLALPQQAISRHLAVFGHLTEAKTASPETLGDDVFEPDKCPAADEQDVRRVEGDAWLSRMLIAARRR